MSIVWFSAVRFPTRVIPHIRAAGIAAPLLAIGGLYAYTGAKFDATTQRISDLQVVQARMEAKLDALNEQRRSIETAASDER